MTTIISIILFLIFLFISSIHFYWAFGGIWGSDAVLPTKEDNIPVIKPGMITTLIVAVGLLSFGLIILIKSAIIIFYTPEWLSRYGLWMITIIFTTRAIGDFSYVGFFKKINGTKFAVHDTKYFSPLCLIIVILTVLIQLNT